MFVKNTSKKMPLLKLQELHVEFDVDPEWCPLCHHAIHPKTSKHFILTGSPNKLETLLEIVCQCPRNQCSHLFIAIYERDTGYNKGIPLFLLRDVSPKNPLLPSISPEIEEISPNFVKIFSQASAAEAYELDEIAGVGYRKALEFLIKDFLVSEDPDSADDILSERLATCVRNRVSDQNVKKCAERAVWLGNDETHYVRRWENKDIQDLKILIRLTMAWIVNSTLTNQYLEDMPGKIP